MLGFQKCVDSAPARLCQVCCCMRCKPHLHSVHEWANAAINAILCSRTSLPRAHTSSADGLLLLLQRSETLVLLDAVQILQCIYHLREGCSNASQKPGLRTWTDVPRACTGSAAGRVQPAFGLMLAEGNTCPSSCQSSLMQDNLTCRARSVRLDRSASSTHRRRSCVAAASCCCRGVC